MTDGSEPADPRPRGRGPVVRLLVSATLLALLVRFGGVDPVEVGRTLAAADGRFLALALLCYGGLGTIVRVMRWRVLIAALGHTTSLVRATQIFLIGVTFNQILPTGIGGDVVRAMMLARDGLGRARAASTVLVERASGMLALLAVGLLALPFAGQSVPPVVRLILLGAGLAGVGGAIVLRQGVEVRQRIARWPFVGRGAAHGGVARFVDSFAEYGWRPIAANFGLSLVFAGVMIWTNALLGRAFGVTQAGLGDWGLVVPLIALSLLVPSIGGLGVREWSYVGLLGALVPPVTADTATAVSLAFHGLNLALAAIGGLIVALRGTGAVVEAVADAVPASGRGKV